MANMHSRATDGLWGFLGITYLLAFLTFGMMAILQMPGASLDDGGGSGALGLVLFLIGGFSPSIAAFVIASVRNGREGRRDLWRRSLQFNLGTRWYFIIVAIFVVAQGAQLIAVVAGGGGLVRPWYLDEPGMFLATIPALLVLGPISEEYGWRGFALDRMLDRWPRPVANLMLGIAWALWHLPLFFIPGTSQSALGAPVQSFLVFALQALALTVIYTWIYRKTNRSIWAAIFLHFMTAFAAFLAGGLVEGGGSFIDTPVVLILTAIAVVITVIEDLRG